MPSSVSAIPVHDENLPMSPMNTASYLSDQTHRTLVDRIETVHLNPGHDLRSTIIEILGDADIWPLKCLEDRLDERRRRRARENKKKDENENSH